MRRSSQGRTRGSRATRTRSRSRRTTCAPGASSSSVNSGCRCTSSTCAAPRRSRIGERSCPRSSAGRARRNGDALDEPLGLRPRGLLSVATHGRLIAFTYAWLRPRLGLRDAALDVVHVLLELADPLAERRADFRDALRPEQYEHDDQNDHELAET